VIWLLSAWLTIQEPIVPDPVPPYREDLKELVFPDLAPMEASVREQILTIREELVTAIGAEARDPLSVRDAYMKLGRACHAYKRYALAEVCYENAATLAPDRFETVYLRADLARVQGRFEEAERGYKEALVLLPTYIPVYVRLGDLALGAHRLDEAEALYEEVQRRQPGEPASIFGLGMVAMERARYDVAIERFEKALELVSEADRIHYLLGMCWRNKGEVDKAKHHLALAGKRGVRVADTLADNLVNYLESGRVHIARGKAAFAAKDYAGAVKEFAQAVSAMPEDAGGWINLGAALAAVGELDKAIEALERAAELEPRNKTATFNIGVLAAEKGDAETAYEAYKATVDLDPKDGVARMELAKLQKQRGELEEAFESYDLVAKLEPNNEEAQIQRAFLLIQVGRYKQSMALLEKDTARNPTFGRLSHLYARMLAACPDESLRDGSRAMQLAGAVVDASPTAEHLETLAMAFAESGDCDNAAITQLKALARAREAQDEALVTRIETDLETYRAGPPCRP